jgi:hypothetical protein
MSGGTAVARTKAGRQRRKARQRVAKRYTKAREDAQLAGLIETSPAGAVRGERVDPGTQGCQPLPGLIGQAVRRRWATTDEMAIRAVAELHRIATDPEVEPHVRVAAIRTAVMADQAQWERDNPELAGKTKGGVKVGMGVQVNGAPQPSLLDLMREAVARPDYLEEAKREALERRDRRSTTPAPDADEGAN